MGDEGMSVSSRSGARAGRARALATAMHKVGCMPCSGRSEARIVCARRPPPTHTIKVSVSNSGAAWANFVLLFFNSYNQDPFVPLAAAPTLRLSISCSSGVNSSHAASSSS